MLEGVRMNKDDIDVVKREIVYEGYFKMLRYNLKYRLFSGQWSELISRDCYNRGNAVCLLLYDPIHDTVVLVEQIRIGAIEYEFDPWLLEVVAGLIDRDEPKEMIAKQEAQEEAGIDVSEVHYIFDFLTSAGASTERVYLYYALIDASKVGGIFGLPSEHEDIKVHVVSSEKAFRWVREGKIKSSMTIIALQWLVLNKENLKKNDK